MKTIVALVDFTEVTSKILDITRTLASALRSKVVLLHVVPPMPVVATFGADAPAIPEPPSQEEVDAQKAKLQTLLDSLTKYGIEATALQFEGPVVATVMDELEKLDADLVIMGSHHHSALYNFFIGSVATELLKRLPFPALVVPVEVVEKADEPAAKERLSAEEMQQKVMTQPIMSV